MKHKPILMNKLQKEKTEIEKQEQDRLKELDREKKEKERQERQKEEKIKVVSKTIQEDPIIEEKEPKGRDSPKVINRPVRQRDSAIVRIFAIIADLISSIFDSLQWIIVSAVVTVALIIIFKYTNATPNDVIEFIKKLFNK